MRIRKKSIGLVAVLAIACLGILAGVSHAADPSAKSSSVTDDAFLYGEDNGIDAEASYDPIEGFNRVIFAFNDKMYFWLLKPIAQGYKFVTPDFFRAGVKNFFTNIAMPPRLVGCVMQGKRAEAEAEVARFLVNSTFGVAGLFDLTSDVKAMNPPEEDPGQALGAYGLGSGFYIVWPVLGPSTLRDTAGGIISYAANPTTYLDISAGAFAAAKSVETVNGVSYRIGDYETIKEAAFDPYVMIRDGYIQRRNAQIKQ